MVNTFRSLHRFPLIRNFLTSLSGKSFVLPVTIFLLNVILKSWYLDRRDLALDEPFTVFYAQANFRDLFVMLRLENNPPLFFILLHYWIKIFGISAFSVRFLPMIFSSLTAVLIYLTGKKHISTRTGLVASLLFTFSNFHMLFAHEARVYSLFAMLSVLSMFIFFSFNSKRSAGKVILLTAVNVLLLYSHFFGVFLILTHGLIILFISKFRKSLGLSFLISLAVTFLFYLPYLPLLLFRFSLTMKMGTWVDKPVVSDLYTMAWRYSNFPMTTVFLLLLLITGTGVYLYRRIYNKIPARPHVTAILIWFFVPYFLMFLLSFGQPIFLDRYTVFISIAYYLLVAVSIDLLFRPGLLPNILSVLAIGLMLVTFTPNTDNKRRLKEGVRLVESLQTPNTAVIICPSWLEYGFTYHHDLGLFKDYPNLRTNLNTNQIYPVDSLSQLSRINLESFSRIIYFEEWAKWIDTEENILHTLDSRYFKVKETVIYENYKIHLYVKKSPKGI